MTRTVVYKFGLRSPSREVADQVLGQMTLAHNYRNILTEIERDRRAEIRKIEATQTAVAEALASMQQAQSSLDEVLKLVKRERQQTGKASPSRRISREHHQAIKSLREELKRRRLAWKEARKASFATIQPLVDDVNQRALVRRKEERSKCGVYWGTYQLVEDADNASRKMPLWTDGLPNDPRFQKWDGCGEVSVQINDGVGIAADGLESSTQIRILPCSTADNRNRDSRRFQMRCRKRLLIRVGSNQDRSPKWAEWQMIEHRPLPAGFRIKRATVHRKMIGPRAKWFLTLTMNVPEVKPNGIDGVVAIDIGWRSLGDGSIRIAAFHEPDSRSSVDRELTLPGEIIRGIVRADTLRATRDKNFDQVRDSLADWIRKSKDRLPDWFAKATESFALWRSQARLASLVLRWRHARFEGDDGAYQYAEQWRKQDKHLWSWESSQRSRSLGMRQDYYRKVAASLAEKNGTVILEDLDLRRFAIRGAVASMEEKEYVQAIARNRTIAAVSELRSAIVNAFRMRGGFVNMVDPTNTTNTCHVCGIVDTWDDPAKVRHTCSNGHEWDRDMNAARNIFDRWRASRDGGPAREPVDAMPVETRWARASRLKRERDDRLGRSQTEGA
ncbi:MAG: zinc ribbon domain-containing protein [Hyphomicrobiaceae bacterium]